MTEQTKRRASPRLIWLVCVLVAAVTVVAIAQARDLGQWAQVDPRVSQWFRSLMQPDNPGVPCCGFADAYWADSFEVEGDHYIAIITDERPDEPLGRPHIDFGTRVPVPNNKIKWNAGNPTGHGVLFIGLGGVYCFVPGGGV